MNGDHGKGDPAFDTSILDVLRTGMRITHGNPRLALRAVRLLRGQQRAARRRSLEESLGLHVPPFVIFSVTGACNLTCAGCYASILHRAARPEMSDERVGALFREARDVGVSVMLLAGGEPLLRRALLDDVLAAPEILFLLFTNGSLLDDDAIRTLRRASHVIPVLSVEGGEDETDARRGAGAYERVTAAMAKLRARRVVFGTSTTLTRSNFEKATGEAYVRDLIRRGCRLFYYINYVPVAPGTDELQLAPDQVAELTRRLTQYRRAMPALFISFPNDEVAFGGCLAAGKGFLHINAYGDVEPCPFSPYSDSSLLKVSFREALASPLFRKIRAEEITLDERDGRCALWKRREWVKGLVGRP
ncbi:MAG: radical SAM protein [Candidatus Bipolaricaulis sp.]|nr:radical SAM protein [Candidatus Bipolaricaulis sp.]